MIRLYDATRRRLALAIFFAAGLVPTLAVSAWGVWWRSARHVAAEARDLSWRLGMIVSIGGVRHLSPGSVAYDDVCIREPERRQLVFRCRNIEARWEQSPSGDRRPVVRAALSGPEVAAAHWHEISHLLDRLLTGRVDTDGLRVRLTSPRLNIVGSQPPQSLEQMEIRVDARAERAAVDVAFRVAGDAEAEPARLVFTRNRQRTPAATAVELDTGGGALPCALLALGIPGWDSWGPASSFRGTLRLELSRDGTSGELVGQFANVDLQSLTADHLAHRLSGSADLTIELAHFRQGRLTEAAGSLVAGPGVVGRSFLEVAIQQLGMSGGSGIDRADPSVPYEHLAFWFACDAGGLRLRGMSPSGAPGTLLFGRNGTLLREPRASDVSLPLAAVVQAFAPGNEELIPIAWRNDWLARRLPHPTDSPPAETPTLDNPLR